MKQQTTKRDVYRVDATGQVPGRLASDIAKHLIGKHKPEYEPMLDRGEEVEVSNVSHMKVSVKKLGQKTYYTHSGYPGGLKKRTMGAVFAKDPARVLILAVSRMLPKNKHRSARLKRLHIS